MHLKFLYETVILYDAQYSIAKKTKSRAEHRKVEAEPFHEVQHSL